MVYAEIHSAGRRRQSVIVKDPKALAAIRLLPCCACQRNGPSHAHHLYAKGMGGGFRNDSRTNLAPLCWKCHANHHNGHYPRFDVLLQSVCQREGLPLEVVRAHCLAVRNELKLPPKEARVRANEILRELSIDYAIRLCPAGEEGEQGPDLLPRPANLGARGHSRPGVADDQGFWRAL